MADSDGKIVIGIEGDPSGINKSLDAVEKKGKDAAQGIGSAFSAIAGALAGAKIVSAFQSAIAQAGKLEQSMLKVASTARSMGESTSKAQKAAMDLAQDGFLSASQAAQTLSNLMATGLNVDQAKKFITASKDITAFGNTIGDAAQATEDLSLGLLRGSALVIDNASPALKSLANKYQQLVDTQGKTAAAQYAYNEIVKTGAKFQGDAARYMDTATGAQARFTAATDAASAAVGKSLQPALKEFYSTLTGLVEGFTKWFSGLNEGTQTIALVGTLLAVVGTAAAAILPTFAALTIANPFAWVGVAIAGVTALLAITSQLLGQKTFEDLSRGYKKARDEINKLAETADGLSKINKRTAQQELQLIDTKEALRRKAKELGLDYDKLAASAKSYLEISRELANKEKLNAQSDLAGRLVNSITRANQIQSGISAREKVISQMEASGNKAEAARQRQYLLTDRAQLERESANARSLNERIDRLGEDDESGKRINTPASGAAGGIEQRFLDSQEKLKEIELNRIATIARAESIKDENERKRRQMRAYEDAELLAKTEVNALRSAYAEYIEDKAMADKLALDKQTDDAIRAIRNQEEAGELTKEQAEYRIAKIREAQIRKEGALRAQSFAETAQAANAITSAFAGLATSKTPVQGLGATGSVFSAVGGISDKFKAFGQLGVGLSAVTGIFSTLQGLFEKSDEQRAEEARVAENQRKEQLVLLELQANYQKNLLALSEAAAKLPFENLQRKMRLADIEASAAKVAGISPDIADKQAQEKKLAAVNSTIASEGGKIAEGALFGDVAATPDSLIAFLSQRAAQQLAVAQFVGLVNAASQYTSTDRSQVNPGPIQEILSEMASYSSLVPPELYNAGYGGLQQYLSAYQNCSSVGPGGVTQAQRDRYFAAQAAFNAAAYSGPVSRVQSLSSEITSDTSIAENLLSTFEQSNQLQLEIAGNTKKTADNTNRLTNLRENNILDLAGGGIRGFGSFFRGAFNSVDSIVNPRMPALATPSAISNSLSVASMTRSWQDRAADGIDSLVKIQTEALRLLAEIALNTDAQGQVQGSLTSAQLQDIMANIRSRIV